MPNLTLTESAWVGSFTISGSTQTLAFPTAETYMSKDIHLTLEGGGGADLDNYVAYETGWLTIPDATYSKYAHSSYSTAATGGSTSYLYIETYYGYSGDDVTSIRMNACSQIGTRAFSNAETLATASFPNCEIIGGGAFYNCITLSTVCLQSCQSIGDFINDKSDYTYSVTSRTYSFYTQPVNYTGTLGNCVALTEISLPHCTYVGSGAFSGCVNLSNVYLPLVASIGALAFNSCPIVCNNENFPNLTTIYGGYLSSRHVTYVSSTGARYPYTKYELYPTFNSAQITSEFTLSTLQTLGFGAFESGSWLKNVYLPNCMSLNDGSQYLYHRTSSSYTYSYTGAFANQQGLSLVSLPKCAYIGQYAFYNCTALSTIYLMGSSRVTLAGSSAFSLAGIGSNKGSIYVPTSLVSAYKSATGWAYFSRRIIGA